MKRILSVLACMAVLFSLSVPVFAVEGEDDDIPVEVVLPADPDEVYEDELLESMTSYSVTALDDTETEVVPDSIPAALTALFGEYSPRTQTVTQYFSDGSEVTYEEYVPGVAGLDWLWLSSVGMFGMGLYCVFRVIGGCLKWT